MLVSSSSLAVGINPKPDLLDESADWEANAFRLPYAISRREAEQEALARPADETPEIVVINPSFTLGPDDYVGAPANSLVKKMSKPGFRLRAPIGFGLLDVRDYAQGALLAAERGRPGQRYLLSGENIDSEKLLQQVAEVAGFEPARFLISLKPWYLRPVVALLNTWKSLRGQPSKVSPSLFDLWDHYAWYDTTRARKDLGWTSRTLRESVQDTIEWMRSRPDA
jgi:dihydroflavonol-4-reductase